MGCSLARTTDLGEVVPENVELKRKFSSDSLTEGRLDLNDVSLNGELLRRRFVRLDKDGDDMLSRKELQALYPESERLLGDRVLQSVFDAVDKESKGKLTWDDFAKWVADAGIKRRTGRIDEDSDGLLKRLGVNMPQWRDSMLFTSETKDEKTNTKLTDVLRIRRDGRVLLCKQWYTLDMGEATADWKWRVFHGKLARQSELGAVDSGDFDVYKLRFRWTDEWCLKHKRQIIQERYRTMPNELKNWTKIHGPRLSFRGGSAGWERACADEDLLSMDLCHRMDWPDGTYVLKLIDVIADAERRDTCQLVHL